MHVAPSTTTCDCTTVIMPRVVNQHPVSVLISCCLFASVSVRARPSVRELVSEFADRWVWVGDRYEIDFSSPFVCSEVSLMNLQLL